MTDPHTHTTSAALHPQADLAASWGDFADAEPGLAAFVAERLQAAPAYLATARASGPPRVHPVTPIITADGLYLFMEPTSPKGADLHERRWFALHNGVTDHAGTGGEAALSGTGHLVTDTNPPTATCCTSSDRPKPSARATAIPPSPSVAVGMPAPTHHDQPSIERERSSTRRRADRHARPQRRSHRGASDPTTTSGRQARDTT
jgi:hypothetical protein